MNWHQLHTGKTLQQRLAELQGKLAELNAPPVRSGAGTNEQSIPA